MGSGSTIPSGEIVVREEVDACIRRERRKQYARIAAVLAIIISVWATGYNGRKDLVASQRRGCERGKLDRRAGALGWRTAQARATSQHQPEYATVYDNIAAGLEQRSRIDCKKVYPDPPLFKIG